MYAQSIPNDPGATYAAKSPAETGPLLSSSQASSRIAPNAASTSSVVRLASAHSRASSSSSGMRSDPPPHVIRPTFPHVCLQQSNLTMASDSLFCCGTDHNIRFSIESGLRCFTWGRYKRRFNLTGIATGGEQSNTSTRCGRRAIPSPALSSLRSAPACPGASAPFSLSAPNSRQFWRRPGR